MAVNFGDLTPNALRSIDFWIKRGWPDFVAFAITGHLQIESYPDLRTQVVGDKHILTKDGVPGGSVGICQWNGVRKQGLFTFAKRYRQDPYDLITQLEYVAYELNTTEKFAGNELAKATTLWGASRAFMHFERPKGYARFWPTLGSHWDRRLAAGVALRENYKKFHAEA